MKTGFPWKRAAMALFLASVLAAGCSKKQTVKSDSGAGPAPGEPALSAPAPGGEGKEAVTEAPVAGMPPAPAPPSPAQTPAVLAKAAEAGVAVTEEKPSRFEDVLFDFDKSDLKEEGKRICRTVADFLRGNPKARVLIEGHCDERGTAEYNLALGERRATAVRNYIVSLGVPKAVFSTVSFGKERPLEPGHNEAAWAKNRRAHFVLK